MIVGASGENIYPEEIESIINNFRLLLIHLLFSKKGNWLPWFRLIWRRWKRNTRFLNRI
jgi:long-chain acyl-CoA synthetase